MAAIDELIEQIDNPMLRERITKEVRRMAKQKKFGLVFEEHLPERTLLYEVPVKRGSLAARNSDTNDLYQVIEIEDDKAVCISKASKEQEEISVSELVSVAEFGEPIYPYLELLDSVENAPDSGLWHTLIEADNYHALQLLDYMYHGKIDCIYIDPPYNTGAKDWKYNNDYVDGNDQYRYSKWLSMMKKRLLLAKKLLNPKDSVLIVTIDEKEYLHLGCLLEELFPEGRMQMVTTVINQGGTKRQNEFSRNDEYIFFVMLGQAVPSSVVRGEEIKDITWKTFRRGDLASKRGSVKGGKAQFYPIYVNKNTGIIEKIGDPILPSVKLEDVEEIDGCVTVFPIRPDGIEMNWGTKKETAEYLLKNGYLRAGSYKPNDPQKYIIQYLTSGTIDSINNGEIIIDSRNNDGSINAHYVHSKELMPLTNWNIKEHNARDYGTLIIKSIFNENRFSFPKSLYAVQYSLSLFLKNKPNALVLDFFAGSGTTLHAVNLMNNEDNGQRTCVLVTNNEVSEEEAQSLYKQGYNPGDDEWNKLGIARFITWPRTVCSIEGHDVYGNSLVGSYLPNNRPMSKGFTTNANFFKLGFLDKNSVAYGTQLDKLIPVLWMKAGAYGKCPDKPSNDKYMIYPENKFAILVNTKYAYEFKQELTESIEVAYIVTDYEPEYHDIANSLKVNITYHLYRDYLDNFTINTGRI